MRLSWLLLAGSLLTGCATGGPDINPGFLFTSVQGPVTTTGKAGAGGKRGEACASNILGIVAIGDNSIETAKKNGGIKQVASVDYNSFSVLGLYYKKCTYVTAASGGGKDS